MEIIDLDKTVSALRQLEKFDKILLIISGDLTDRADENAYKAVRGLIGKLLINLSGTYNCGFINTLVVPGNHDIKLSKGCRGANKILNWNKDEHLGTELDKMKHFFNYANSKQCFKENKICDVKNITMDNLNIQVCLLNSAPYSTIEDDDKQLHYLPTYIGEKLNRTEKADLKITVMHHSYEWFDWDTKAMLKESLVTDDVVFFGHDHEPESLELIRGDGSKLNIIKGGKFTLDINKDSAFNVLLFDSDTSEIARYEFNWDIESHIFVKSDRGCLSTKTIELRPTEEYLDKLLGDKQNFSKHFTDYYVMPKLLPEGAAFFDTHSERIDAEEIFNALKKEKAIRITGGNGSGKSSILKYLYSESINRGFLPLFIEKRDYTDSRIEKMFKDMFERQYGDKINQGYNIYDQSDHSKEIVFIDDIDLIENDKARSKLIDYIISSDRLLICSAKENNRDLEDFVKERLQGKSLSSLGILPFYKETRDELVKRICKLRDVKTADKDTVIMALDYMVQSQTNFFSFTPGNLLQYIKYLLNSGFDEGKGNKIFSLIFETNIRNAILNLTRESEANVYLKLLEFIADKMYFEIRSENISLAAFEDIVSSYNKKRRASVIPKRFLGVCQKAQVLKEAEDSFDICFYDKNTFAYFVARYVNAMLEKDPTDQEKLTYVMEHICFGINDTIIVFLSFIRNNVKIILQIAAKSAELVYSYQEWDFDKNNIPFLTQSEMLTNNVPQIEDKKEAKRNTEQIEKTRQEAVKFRGIFDFNEEDVNRERYKILRALKYTQIVGRALVDQYGSLDSEEIDVMVKTLYSVTQKIIFASLKPYEEHKEEIIKNILEFAKKEIPSEKITEDYVRKILGQSGIMLALNIMNDIAYNSSNDITIAALKDIDITTSNYKIMQLMMEENAGNTGEFVIDAIKKYEDFKDNHFGKMLISQIARKHIIYTESIDHKQIDKLVSAGIFSSKGKKSLLLEQGEKKKN